MTCRSVVLLATLTVAVCTCANGLIAQAEPMSQNPTVTGEPVVAARQFNAAIHIRQIMDTQRRIADGDAAALAVLSENLARAGEDFRRAQPAAWTDAANRNALLTFALIGGEPRILKSALSAIALSVQDEKLVSGVIALASLETAKARQNLLPIRLAHLPSALAGAIALSLGALMAPTDAELAISLLGEARLVAPATLIEETAYRREIAIYLERGEFTDALRISRRYTWRFPHSLYAPQIMESMAVQIGRGLSATSERGVLSAIAELPVSSPAANRLVLDLIRETMLAGHVETAAKLMSLAKGRAWGSEIERHRLRLYALALTSHRLESGEQTELNSLLRTDFTVRDNQLRAQVVLIAEQDRNQSAHSSSAASVGALVSIDEIKRRAAASTDVAGQLLKEFP